MFKILKTYFPDQDPTAILAKAERYVKSDVVEKLQDVQHKGWLDDAATAREIFSKLKLNEQGEKLFESPALSRWTNYVTKLDASNADELIISTLKTRYTDEALATLVLGAKKSDNTKAMAEKIAEAQLKHWLSSDKSADDVYTILELDNQADKLFKQPLLSTWITFAQKRKENPYKILLAKLKSSELANTDKLFDILVKAKKKSSTIAIAANMEATQLKIWLSEGKTASDVFKLLKLETTKDYLLHYSRTSSWLAYVTKLDPKNSDEIIYSVLKTYYDDVALASMLSMGNYHADITAKLRDVVLKNWLSEGKSAGNDTTWC